jgi:hypothetical protein
VLCTEVLPHLLPAAVQTVHQVSAPPAPRLSLWLRTVSTTWRIASITIWGCSPWMKWPLFVSVMCLASRRVAS